MRFRYANEQEIFPHIAFRLREIDEEWADTARMDGHYRDWVRRAIAIARSRCGSEELQM
jgi:hypothetical protein